MTGRAPLLVLLIALVAALGLVACGDDESSDTGTTAAPGRENSGATEPKQAKGAGGVTVETIVIRGGSPVGGARELEYDAGEQVRFRVRSDVADEIHVHGFDLSKDVAAGGTVDFSFPADIEGIFEVELEERGELIAELTVNP
jgi:hypothetical protein